jgi:hypothetical protein
MAQKSGPGKKPARAAEKKITPVKKTALKKKKNTEKKPAVAKKNIGKTKEIKKVSEIKEIKKPVIVLHEFRVNIRCRSCSFVDGYASGEKVCHNCKNEIYEIDKI